MYIKIEIHSGYACVSKIGFETVHTPIRFRFCLKKKIVSQRRELLYNGNKSIDPERFPRNEDALPECIVQNREHYTGAACARVRLQFVARNQRDHYRFNILYVIVYVLLLLP